MDRYGDTLGPPDLSLCGFSLWVHRAAAPGAEPYDDWLDVTAHCAAEGASVWTRGEILLRWEVARWLGELAALYERLSGAARLQPMEQSLDLLVGVERTGHLRVTVDITPDAMTQRHQFTFQVDQSYLPPLLRQGRTLMRRLEAVQPLSAWPGGSEDQFPRG